MVYGILTQKGKIVITIKYLIEKETLIRWEAQQDFFSYWRKGQRRRVFGISLLSFFVSQGPRGIGICRVKQGMATCCYNI